MEGCFKNPMWRPRRLCESLFPGSQTDAQAPPGSLGHRGDRREQPKQTACPPWKYTFLADLRDAAHSATTLHAW